jgi:enoyl-CoA hydratase/carnithine racemase
VGLALNFRYGLKPTAVSIVRGMSFETLLVDRADGIVTITLNRPEKKNAANGQMWDELLGVFTEIAGSVDDRVVVITGAGGAFCSGADVSGMGGREVHGLASMRHISSIATALYRLPQPTIAKVRGIAAGAGMNMALLCDLIVASDNARFSEIFARRGLTIDFGGSWVLPRRIGMHRAKELTLLTDIIDAAEADRIGLVNRVIPDGELDAFVADWAGRLAAGPPIALAQSKRLLNNAVGITIEQALEEEGAAQTINFATKDTAEAVAAFMEKRDPTFHGR